MTDTDRLTRQRLARARAEGCLGCIYCGPEGTHPYYGDIIQCHRAHGSPQEFALPMWCGEWFPREPDEETSNG